ADQPLRLGIGDGPPSEVKAHAGPRPLVERAVVKSKVASLLLEKPSLEQREQVVALSTRYRVLSPYTSLLVLETERDYQRYGIDRAARADILTVLDGRL